MPAVDRIVGSALAELGGWGMRGLGWRLGCCLHLPPDVMAEWFGGGIQLTRYIGCEEQVLRCAGP